MKSGDRRGFLQIAVSCLAVCAAVAGGTLLAQGPEPARGVTFAQVSATDMKEWLSYLASDELQGRQAFTEGYGLAASYVAANLKTWGVKPLGDGGTYFENVRIRGYRVTRTSSVAVVAPNGTTSTFKHGDHVTFPAGPGGQQTLTFTGAEFIGYGQTSDLKDRDVKDKLVVWMPNLAPAAGGGRGGGRGGAVAINTFRARAAIGFAPTANATEAERALTQAGCSPESD